MIVVMQQGASDKQIEHVIKLIRELGLTEHVIKGTERTVVAAVGDDRAKNKENLENVPGVEKVMPVLAPYKMASKEVKKERTVVSLGGTLGAAIGGKKVCVIAGPCSVESREQLLQCAQ
jgi:3-deoxy-7-phosphoheptulonate synthase